MPIPLTRKPHKLPNATPQLPPLPFERELMKKR
uniref:Uncharacterized protein n=1 Tax=Arundo donax TaxID=35708 RepID=A0A0A9GJD9_ARUDO